MSRWLPEGASGPAASGLTTGCRPSPGAWSGTCPGRSDANGTNGTRTRRIRAVRAAGWASASRPRAGGATGAPSHPPGSACPRRRGRRHGRDPVAGLSKRLPRDDQSDGSSRLHLTVGAVGRVGLPRFRMPPDGGRCAHDVPPSIVAHRRACCAPARAAPSRPGASWRSDIDGSGAPGGCHACRGSWPEQARAPRGAREAAHPSWRRPGGRTVGRRSRCGPSQ